NRPMPQPYSSTRRGAKCTATRSRTISKISATSFSPDRKNSRSASGVRFAERYRGSVTIVKYGSRRMKSSLGCMKTAAMVCALTIAFMGVNATADDRVLRWGGDAEGGAPFVEADPRDPSILRGFDFEVAGQ